MINIYTSAKIPHVGGMSTHILGIRDYLMNTNRECNIYAKPGDIVPKSGGAVKFHPFIYLLGVLGKIAYCRIRFPAAVGNHNFFHDWFSIIGVKGSKNSSKILYVHGELANELVALGTISKNSFWYRLFQKVEIAAAKRASKIICVDTRLAEYVRTQLGFEAISKSNFVSTPQPIREPDAPVDSVRIVLSRRFVEKNGLLYALQAVEIVQKTLANKLRIECDVFGTGQLFSALSSEFSRPYIRFHGDVTPERVREYLRKAHFSLVPSVPVGDYVEATSISALEAAAEGCIVVASDVGGLRDLFAGTGGACLVPPGNPEAIATAMLELIREPDLFARTASIGQHVVLKNHSDAVYVDDFLVHL